MKRIVSILVLIVTFVGVSFASVVKIGDLSYELDKSNKTALVTDYKKKCTTITIPSSITYKGESYSVTGIGSYAFSSCINLTSIIIPNSVAFIGPGAFSNCYSLKKITIPNSVTSVWRGAFDGCKNLRSVTLNSNALVSTDYISNSHDIPSLAAYFGYQVTEYILGDDITTIGNHAFYNCTYLHKITIGNNVTSIGEGAFYSCSNLTSVTIPNNVTSIGEGAFYSCSNLTSVTIPNNVTSIPEKAFLGCKSLTNVTIGSSTKYIGVSAFQNCSSLKSITIPNSVATIDAEAFKDCSNLTNVTFGNNIKHIENYSFWGCKELTNLEFPHGLKRIGKLAFTSCYNLEKIIIPSSVTSIGENAFYYNSKLIIYTASIVSIPNIPSIHIQEISPNNQQYYYSYTTFAKRYVEKGINQWQQKGEFERTVDWQKRVTEQTRHQKINELLANAEQTYIAYWTQKNQFNLELGRYDADNEVFVIQDSLYGTAYIAVPYDEAQVFKNNWSKKELSCQLQIKDNQFKLASLTITMPNRKQYTYRNTDAVNYNLAEIDYNFAPIELNLSSSDTQPDKQKNQKTTIRSGKSLVDTDIPTTGASNPNTFVIIFANEDYKNVVSVPFAKNDGTIFQKYCQKTLGIPTSNIHYVENASYNDIRIQLAWLNDVCDAFDGKASIIVYYSGHGIPDEASKSAYLLPVDGDGRYVQSAYKVDDLYQKLGAMNAKSVTIFMDACFSGATRSNTMVAQAKGVALKAKNSIPQGRTVVFSAAQGDESAGFFEEEGHGLFTYYLLKKLQETKGDVSLQDLGEYIITNVRKQSIVNNGKSQTPCVTPSPSATDWQNWKLK